MTRMVLVEEMAERTGLSTKTIQQKIRAGEIPGGKKLGRRLVVPEDRFQAYLDNLPDASEAQTAPI